jgi:hypothetical protein
MARMKLRRSCVVTMLVLPTDEPEPRGAAPGSPPRWSRAAQPGEFLNRNI